MLRFVGFLANVDDSLLPLGSIRGFTLEKWKATDAVRLVVRLTRATEHWARVLLVAQLKCYRPTGAANPPVFVMTRTVDTAVGSPEPTDAEMELLGSSTRLIEMFDRMRLFEDGNPCMPLSFIHRTGAIRFKAVSEMRYLNIVTAAPFQVPANKVDALRRYLSARANPLRRPELQRAFNHLALSFEVSNRQLAFTAVIIGIETLLGADDDRTEGTRSRIGKRLALLIGTDKRDRKLIQSRFEEFYDKRVGYVHHGRTTDIKDSDLAEARSYLRRAVKEASERDLSDAELRHGARKPNGASSAGS